MNAQDTSTSLNENVDARRHAELAEAVVFASETSKNPTHTTLQEAIGDQVQRRETKKGTRAFSAVIYKTAT